MILHRSFSLNGFMNACCNHAGTPLCSLARFDMDGVKAKGVTYHIQTDGITGIVPYEIQIDRTRQELDSRLGSLLPQLLWPASPDSLSSPVTW